MPLLTTVCGIEVEQCIVLEFVLTRGAIAIPENSTQLSFVCHKSRLTRFLPGTGESLCPDCTQFTTSVLKPIFLSGLGQLIDFSYIGWGNVAKLGGEYKCQHGPLECTMNTVLNCGQELSTHQDQFFEFLYCIESQIGPDVEKQIPGCAKAAGIELNPLEECYKGEAGEKLDAKARKETDGLQPPHTYVPWVTVNGKPLGEQTDLLASHICAAYTGDKPAACSKAQGMSGLQDTYVHSAI